MPSYPLSRSTYFAKPIQSSNLSLWQVWKSKMMWTRPQRIGRTPADSAGPPGITSGDQSHLSDLKVVSLNGRSVAFQCFTGCAKLGLQHDLLLKLRHSHLPNANCPMMICSISMSANVGNIGTFMTMMPFSWSSWSMTSGRLAVSSLRTVVIRVFFKCWDIARTGMSVNEIRWNMMTYMYVCIYIYIHITIHVHTCIVYVNVFVYVYVYVSVHVCVCMCMYMYVYVCVCMCMCICNYMYTYTYIFIHELNVYSIRFDTLICIATKH